MAFFRMNKNDVDNLDGAALTPDEIILSVNTNGFAVYKVEYSSATVDGKNVIQPKYNGTSVRLRRVPLMAEQVVAGDIVLDISPATVGQDATAAAWTRDVVLTLKDSNGKVHEWCNMTFSTKASIADTSTAGTASIASQDITFVSGSATITVSGDAASWLATETNTLTIANLTINGVTVTGGTSVGTFS